MERVKHQSQPSVLSPGRGSDAGRGSGRSSLTALARSMGVLVLASAAITNAAVPTFENQTPTGFSAVDSTDKQDFVEGQDVTVRVDLNQAATPTYPVIGNFHNLETAELLESRDVDGIRADVAVSDGGIIHTAWITQEVVLPVTTPVYNVRYARSNDGGDTFSSPVSVSGSLRFDLLTIDGGGPSFSTVDIEVDSRGNPRVVYAFNHSPDGHTVEFASNPDNIYFNHSENGGANWLPNNSAIRVNDIDVVGTEGVLSAFPRMAIDQRDNIFITYVRGTTITAAGGDDVMLAKVDRSTSPFTMEQIGSTGTVGSSGGVRITGDAERHTSPDIDVGTGDVLHLIFFREDTVSANSTIEHKTLLADFWNVVDASGWNQGVDGAQLDGFDPGPATNALLEQRATFYFPSIAVDEVSTPDRIYAFYKSASAGIETVVFNSYVYDNAIGGNAGWLQAQASPVWGTASSVVFADGNLAYNIELDWTVTERVEAVVDDRRPDRGDIHIVFTAGYSNIAGGASEHDVYYGFYNGVTWTLPEKVADDDSDATTEDGIRATDTYLVAPTIAKGSDSENIYMVFGGGTAEGLGVSGVTNANHHAYFKVLGRAVTSEDVSVPVGGFQYDLDYSPVNFHDASADIDNQAVWVHVADNVDGDGLGATGKQGDGFLAGEWETVAAFSLADDDKFFEGKVNEDPSNTHEWGDDNDKIGLLVKLNVLGSDSATNLQVVVNSTASDAGSGKGARAISVSNADPTLNVDTFISPLDFFLLGADIDIIDSNTAPTVHVFQPDGIGDTANESYSIKYTLTDPDDDIPSGGLLAALYFSEHSDLTSVQDIEIFGTKIVDENDNSTVFAAGTDDFTEAAKESYLWDNPSAALKAQLFASIFQVPSGNYFIYLVADDQKNPPVFARSSGAVTILHKPIVEYVDPAAIDTVDTGVRSGRLANPYDLDFFVRDFDSHGNAEVQLFFSAVSGLSSVSISGFYPNQNFVLGKSVSGVRATAIENSDWLTTSDVEFSWDLTDSVYVNGDSAIVAEGSYFLYAVANDSVNTSVGQSKGHLIVKHSPQFTFFEPPRDTHREIDTGTQPGYTIQWQKGSGDDDFDDNANIDIHFTTVNPATTNFEDFPDSLLRHLSTKKVVSGLSEDGDAENDMYVWNFRDPAADVPKHGQKVFLYAVISDDAGNRDVELGGALTLDHVPSVTLFSSDLADLASFDLNDVLRITWDDYLIDDGSGTDDAYIRLYADDTGGDFTSIRAVDAAVDGAETFLLNSSNGDITGTIHTLRESSVNYFDWNTKLFGSSSTSYDIYIAISADPTFSNNTAGGHQLEMSSTALRIVGAAGTPPNVSLSPTDQTIAIGDTITFDVMVQHSVPINLVQIVMSVGSTDFQVIDQYATQAGTQPFIDLDNVFTGSTPIENALDGTDLRFAKSSFGGELVGTPTEPVRLAQFQVAALNTLDGAPTLTFTGGTSGTVFGLVGDSDPLTTPSLTAPAPQLTQVRRGIISATVKLEGRTIPPAAGDHTTLLDVHLRVPGSTVDLTDANYIARNDTDLTTAASVEVQTTAAGALGLFGLTAGRYVLTVKDSSHVSGRTDTITVRNGETVTINASSLGFFGSDLRGDPTPLLPSTGAELIAGDASEDNEINEDDVNIIIAAWGTDDTKPSFEQADMNNDDEVGAADLTVTTSNFGNVTGFGAPPVYKPLASGIEWPQRGELRASGDNSSAALELRALFDTQERMMPGDEIGFEVVVRDLEDLAGYELRLRYDQQALRILPGKTTRGEVFSGNRRGAVFEARQGDDGELRIISSRIGKEWAAAGDASLAELWFKVSDGNVEDAIEVAEGLLLNPEYQPARVRWHGSLADLLLPAQVELDQNYPNPFNPSTSIPFALPNTPGDVRLEIYNVIGQRVRTLMAGPMDSGLHTVVWNGRDDAGRAVGAGLYFSILEAGEFTQTRKMLLLK